MYVGDGAQVAVVDEGFLAAFVEKTEGFHVYLSGVLLDSEAGMQGDLHDGGIVEHGQEVEALHAVAES